MRKAYSFSSRHSFPDIRSLLNAQPNARWRGGDSEVWGAYLTNTPEGEAKIRIFSDGERHVIDISTFRDDPAIIERALASFHEVLVPLLGADDIQPHAGWEG